MKALGIAMFLLVGLHERPAVAVSVTINFDGFDGMNFLGGPIPAPSRLSDQLIASTGARFSTTNGAAFVGIVNLVIGSPQPHAPTDPNGIGGATTAASLSYGVAMRPIRVSFWAPENSLVPATTSAVSVTADRRGSGSLNTVYLVAYDEHGTMLASSSQPDVGGPILSVSFPGIQYVEMYSGDGSVAFDNLTFDAVEPIAVGVDGRTWTAVKRLYIW